MAAEVKTEFKIPDLWFDFYARLIPGSVFIVSLRTFTFEISTIPETNEIFILLGAAYFAGLMTQPLASRIVKKIHEKAEKNHHNVKDKEIKDELWVKRLQFQLGRETRDSLILSKMHGEVTMFVQVGIMAVLFFVQHILRQFFCETECANFCSCWSIYLICFIAAILSFLGAKDIADRRVKRAAEIKIFKLNGDIKESKTSEND